MNDKVEAIPEEFMRRADLWFHLQQLKKKMRLQFLKDIQRMTAEGATVKRNRSNASYRWREGRC